MLLVMAMMAATVVSVAERALSGRWANAAGDGDDGCNGSERR
jgi:hypothetical protein